MQQMALRKSEALWTASQRKRRHDEPPQKSATKKSQDVKVNITSCNGISFLIPFSSNKTYTKDDTDQV